MASFLFPLFMPRGQVARRAAARAGGHHAVRRGLPRRDRARRPAGDPARARSRRRERSACRYWQTQRKIVLPQALAIVVPSIMNSFIAHLQGHVAGDDREPLRAHRRARASRSTPTPTGGRSRSRATSSSPLIYFAFCFAMSRYSLWIEKQLAVSRTAEHAPGPTMTEPIIRFDKVNKWYGNNFHVLRDIDLAVAHGRAHRDLRAVGLGQVDADPLHQPARGAPGGPAHRSTASSSPTT